MALNSGGSSGGLGRFVKIVNGRPVIRIGALLSSASASFLWAYWKGYIAVLETVGGGITGALDDAAAFLYAPGGLVSEIFEIPVSASDAAWTSNAQFIASTFGPFALPALVLELAVILWLILEFAPRGVRYVMGAFV